MSILVTHGLEKRYGKGAAQVMALRGVDLRVESGEFVAIMGPSGSGKSTLLNVIGGLEAPSAGDVWLDGEPVSRLDAQGLTRLRREKVGFIFQSYNLLPVLTALENVALPLIIQGHEPAAVQQRAEAMLRRVGLWERRQHRPGALSGGQQQRVAIARALVKEPALVLADEPTGNLDSQSRQEVLQVLTQAVRACGQTLLLITHDPAVAAAADRVLVLQDGQLAGERRGHHVLA